MTRKRDDRKTITAWALYDFANSAYITLIVTFIFNSYFTRRIAADPTDGTVLWTWGGVATSAAIVGVMSPFLGAMADYSGRKKPFLLFFTALCAVCTALLFTVKPGEVVAALVLFVLANIGFEAANVFYNAFLPEISTKETIGRVSGIGWATGYAGGLICMAIALGMIQSWIPKSGDLNVRATNLLAAGWYALFAIPIFLFVRETPRNEGLSAAKLIRVGVRRLSTTFHQLRAFREAAKLLIASLVYSNGLTVVFSLAAIYAAAAFGMTQTEVLMLGLWLNVVAGIGAFS
ncbi:MAG TPA: MFS transporter, partial [Thermoanaerobaculia bacterium]